MTEVNDFEREDDVSLATGVTALANPHSHVSTSLNQTEPLAGARDLRLDFSYRNEGPIPQNPYGQWSYLPLRLADAPRALSTLTGVRILLRTSSPRTVRIDLDSSEYEASVEGIKFGWDVPTDSTPRTVELRFAEAALPSWARLTGDSLPRVLARVEGLAFQPYCAGRDAAGFLPEGEADPGFLEVDQLEFF